MARLRGYMVSGKHPEEGAVLVFAYTAAMAKRISWRTIVEDYGLGWFPDVTVRWLREADPETWGVSVPTVLEPDGCSICMCWHAEGPLDERRLCKQCCPHLYEESA